MDFGSEDLADLSKTTRVLTIILAEDWRGGLLLAGFRGGLSKTTPELLLLNTPGRLAKAAGSGYEAALSGRHDRDAAIAQLVEHLIRNEGVGGSNPSCGTIPILGDDHR